MNPLLILAIGAGAFVVAKGGVSQAVSALTGNPSKGIDGATAPGPSTSQQICGAIGQVAGGYYGGSAGAQFGALNQQNPLCNAALQYGYQYGTTAVKVAYDGAKTAVTSVYDGAKSAVSAVGGVIGSIF